MFRFKKGALCAVALATLVLAGCTTTNTETKLSDLEMQRSAMQRWNACLERNSSALKGTAIQISQLLKHNCEGHKRDVVASFPRHLAKQIDQMLISNAYELMNSEKDLSELSSQQGDLIKTLLR